MTIQNLAPSLIVWEFKGCIYSETAKVVDGVYYINLSDTHDNWEKQYGTIEQAFERVQPRILANKTIRELPELWTTVH